MKITRQQLRKLIKEVDDGIELFSDDKNYDASQDIDKTREFYDNARSSRKASKERQLASVIEEILNEDMHYEWDDALKYAKEKLDDSEFDDQDLKNIRLGMTVEINQELIDAYNNSNDETWNNLLKTYDASQGITKELVNLLP